MSGKRVVGARMSVLLVSCLPLLLAAAPPSTSLVADAAMRDDAQAVRSLLKQGEDVNAAQGDGMTALHWAETNGDVNVAQMLIYAGANLEAVTRVGDYTPLHLASKSGNAAVVETLVKAGGDVGATTTAGGATPLHFAAAVGNVEAIGVLLDHGAEIDTGEAAWGQTPLMFAATNNRVQAVEVLLQRGADSEVTTKVVDVTKHDEMMKVAKKRRDRRLAVMSSSLVGPQTAEPKGDTPLEETAKPANEGEAKESAGGESEAKSPGESEAGDEAKKPPKSVDANESQQQDPPKQAQPEEFGDPLSRAQMAGGQVAGPEEPEEEEPDREEAEGEPPDYADLVGRHGGLTALLHAVREGHVETVRALVDADADINQVSAEITRALC